MARKSRPVLSKLVSTGRLLLIVNYLNENNLIETISFPMNSMLAARSRAHYIQSDGLVIEIGGVVTIYPPHRVLKFTITEELRAEEIEINPS